MHVTKVYFIQLVLKIKYVEFEDKPNNFYLKKTENVKIFTARRLIINFLPKNEKYENWQSCKRYFFEVFKTQNTKYF